MNTFSQVLQVVAITRWSVLELHATVSPGHSYFFWPATEGPMSLVWSLTSVTQRKGEARSDHGAIMYLPWEICPSRGVAAPTTLHSGGQEFCGFLKGFTSLGRRSLELLTKFESNAGHLKFLSKLHSFWIYICRT